MSALTNVIDKCPSLETCKRPEESVLMELSALLDNGNASPSQLSQPVDKLYKAFREYSTENDISSILIENNDYLLEIDKSLTSTSINSTTDKPCKLLRLICNSWQATCTLQIKLEKLHLLIIFLCPSAYTLTIEEIEQSWRILCDTYTHLFNGGAICPPETSCNNPGNSILSPSEFALNEKSLSSNSDWITNCIEFARDNSEQIDSLLYIAIRLFLQCNKLLQSCEKLHLTHSPNSIDVLESIMEKCQSIESDFMLAETLITKRPICTSICEFNRDYIPDEITLADAQQRAKHLQTQFLFETENLQNSNLNAKILNNVSQVFSLSNGCSFDFAAYTVTVSAINEQLDDIDAKLATFLDAVEFLLLFDKLKGKFVKGHDFLRKFDCTMFEEYLVMKNYRSEINSYFYSSHWVDQCHSEKMKLQMLFQTFCHEMDMNSEIIHKLFLNSQIAKTIVDFIETEFSDIIQIQNDVNRFYEEGCRELQDISNECDNISKILHKRLNLTTPKHLQICDFAGFQAHQSNLRQERDDFKFFLSSIETIQISSDTLCEKSTGEVQQSIQEKLQNLRDIHSQINSSVECAIEECFSASCSVSDIEDIFIKVEEAIEAAKANLEDKVKEHSKGKYEGISKFLKTRIDTLKKRSKKLGEVIGIINQLKRDELQYLDISELENKFDCLRKNRENILVFIRNLLELEIKAEFDKCQSLLAFAFTNLSTYQPCLKFWQEGTPEALEINYSEKLNEIENFFNEELSEKILNAIENLKMDCIYVSDTLIEENIEEFQHSFSNLDSQQELTKNLLHFVIVFNELEARIDSCRSFLSSVVESELNFNLENFSDQLTNTFNESFFEQCSNTLTNLHDSYQSYTCEDYTTHYLPIPIPVIDRKYGDIVNVFKNLKSDYSQTTNIINELEFNVNEYNEQSRKLIREASEFYQLLKQSEKRSYLNSTELSNECQEWEVRIRAIENQLAEYQQSFVKSKSTVPICKSVELNNQILPQARQLSKNLAACSHQVNKFEADLRETKIMFDNFIKTFSHFYIEQRHPTAELRNVNVEEKFNSYIKDLEKLQSSVKDLRNHLIIVQGSCHGIVDDFSSQDREISLLTENIHFWKQKIEIVISHLNSNEITTNSVASSASDSTSDLKIQNEPIPDLLRQHPLPDCKTDVDIKSVKFSHVGATLSLPEFNNSHISSPLVFSLNEENVHTLTGKHGTNSTKVPVPYENGLNGEDHITNLVTYSNSGELDSDNPGETVTNIEHCNQIINNLMKFYNSYQIPPGPHLEDTETFDSLIAEIDSKFIQCTTEVKSLLEYNDEETNEDEIKKTCNELETRLKEKRENLKLQIKEATTKWIELQGLIISLEGSAKASQAEIKLLENDLSNESLSEDYYFDMEYRAESSRDSCIDAMTKLKQIFTEARLTCACEEFCFKWQNTLKNTDALLKIQPSKFDRILAEICNYNDGSSQHGNTNITQHPFPDPVCSNLTTQNLIITHTHNLDSETIYGKTRLIENSTAEAPAPDIHFANTECNTQAPTTTRLNKWYSYKLWGFTVAVSVPLILYAYIYSEIVHLYQNPAPLSF